jgi:probable selenate reductase FAD-binding subunit
MYEGVEAFYRPASIREALHLLRRGNGSARIVAGCTDLMLERDTNVRFLIDITHAGLTYIRRRRGAWAIGATTTMSEIEGSAELWAVAGGLLCRAAAACGSVEIRNMATVGGNMANGSPAADLATPLLALDAKAVIVNARGGKTLPLTDYLVGARSRELRYSLLTEVTLPAVPAGRRIGWSFQKFGRTAVDISVANIAAGLELDVRRRVKWMRLALGGVAPAPLRMQEIEASMTGRPFDRSLLAEARALVESAVQPVDDVRASADYRRHISGVLTERALLECADRTAPGGCCI